MKTAYAKVAVQKMKADEQTAIAVQAKMDAEGAQERGRIEGAAQAKASYDKCFDEALPIIQDNVFTKVWGLGMDLLSVAPEDPRRKDIPLPSKQQAEGEGEEEAKEPGTEVAALQPPTAAGDTPRIPTTTPTAAELIQVKQEIGAELAAGTGSGTTAATDSAVVDVD